MNQITKIIIKKKIAVLFEDGTRKQNLNPASVVDLLGEFQLVQIEYDPDHEESAQLVEALLEQIPESGLVEDEEGVRYLQKVSLESEPVPEIEPVPELELVPEIEPVPVVGIDMSQFQPVEDMETLSEEKGVPEKVSHTPFIILGPGDIFEDAEVAYKFIKETYYREVSVPKKYYNWLTATFLAGKPEGQIKSLFSDFKKYGMGVQGKVQAFMEHARSGESALLRQYLECPYLPTDQKVLTEKGRVDTSYFKFWVLKKLFFM